MARRLGIAGGIVAILGLVLGGAYLTFDHRMVTPVHPGAKGNAVLRVERGDTFDQVTTELWRLELVADPFLFDLRSRQRGARAVRAGIYVIRRRDSPDAILERLRHPPTRTLEADRGRLVIVPGENVFATAEKLRAMKAAGDLWALARDRAALERLRVPVPATVPATAHSLIEGYLFPDTYFLDPDHPTVAAAVKRATRHFQKVWRELTTRYAAGYQRARTELGLSDHQLVTLASLVEKEVSERSEAPMVAAVFYNRLRRKQPLQTDPTLVYGPSSWREVPSPRHRKATGNPYNTYQRRGLPPGPIGSPGRAALAAVLAPAETDALYFVARRDGTGRHAFARTYEEHKANIQRYLRKK